MTLVFSMAIASLFAAGAYLMLKRDLIRLIAGMIMIGNAANLFIMASALRRGRANILPANGDRLADPLVQAMVLTAIVISFATAALALVVVYRVYTSHLSVDISDISAAEEEQSELDEPRAEDMIETELEDEIEDLVESPLVEVPL
ncbi:MAG: sodium:proton antiporter [Thermomicrobiales bacterium]|nr:sodium:proton antiporter [Thermomicrobiales bacterium]MCO5218349.1 sodium:proton antiporter [Thermomicrobiales bacterium]MCO5227071.1 sodium:proton antiporter [Thermomicrobiales bacterium]